MKCIDGIEGVLLGVIAGFVGLYDGGEMDALGYIRAVKSLIESASQFVQVRPEIETPASFLQNVLYQEARSGFLDALIRKRERDAEEDGEAGTGAVEGYAEHFYDYVYRRGVYPD